MKNLPWLDPARVAALEAALARRILVLDGAMGTMLQAYRLDETGYRGTRFRDGHDSHAHEHAHRSCDLKGNNDLLSLTQPDIVRAVHRAYRRFHSARTSTALEPRRSALRRRTSKLSD